MGLPTELREFLKSDKVLMAKLKCGRTWIFTSHLEDDPDCECCKEYLVGHGTEDHLGDPGA